MLGVASVAESNAESNPSNFLLFTLLLFSSFAVVLRRNLPWQELARNNKAIITLYIFLALSSLWSPDPLVTFRRVLKDFGSFLIVLVVLSEPHPWRCARAAFVRVSYILFPLSFVVSKYYPDIGRYTSRSWESFYTGLTTHKNTLGVVTMISLLMIFWDYLEIENEIDKPGLTLAKRQRAVAIVIGLLLVSMSQSATAQICLLVGAGLIIILRKLSRKHNGKRLFRNGLLVIVALALADKTLGLSETIAEMFGRNMTLTGRTVIWSVVLDHQVHPILGFGYYAFWDTPIVESVYEEAGDLIHIRTAHNGYLEMYIDGGIVGTILLICFLVGICYSSYRRAFDDSNSQVIPMAIVVVAMFYNNSETSFFRTDMLWFTLMLFTTILPNTSPENSNLAPYEAIQSDSERGQVT